LEEEDAMLRWIALPLLSLVLSAPLASAAPITVEVPLSPQLEVPSIPDGTGPGESQAAGLAQITFDPAFPDDGITFVLNLTNIDTPLQQGHIHLAPPGVNGPIAVDFFHFIGTPSQIFGALVVLPGEASLRAGRTWQEVIDAIQAGEAYVNVHTQEFQGGELRGNFEAAVPEPAMLVLLGAGLSLLALRRRSER
jgi:hypothetical protein